MRYTLTLLLILLCSTSLSAIKHGNIIGGAPVESWEDGGNDFFVMFNSLVDDKITLFEEDQNRQGDSCLESSDFVLTDKHIPDDAIIVKAYLVWMGAVDPAKLTDPTDNSVNLAFTSSKKTENNAPISLSSEVTGDLQGGLGDEATFSFESIKFSHDSLRTGCSETTKGDIVTDEIGFFTYRKDITSFFTELQEQGDQEGFKRGESLYGTYTFSGLDCTDHDYYKCITSMVSNWSIFVVYQSGKINAKKIYFYNGLSYAQNEKSLFNVTGFELPKEPTMKISYLVAEGDPDLFNKFMYPEEMSLRGQGAGSNYKLTNKCNPLVERNGETYYEIFNSNSSILELNENDATIACIEGDSTKNQYYGIDVDTFLLDSEKDSDLLEHMAYGSTSMNLTFSVNQDAILTNFLVLSVDTKSPAYDIPENAVINFPNGREKHFCSCSNEEDAFCLGRPFYYLIRVQNWGMNKASKVRVTDTLDKLLEYIPGTTEYATKFNSKGDGLNWTSIPDKNGKFPLSGDGVVVAEELDICDDEQMTCDQSVLIRFKVNPISDLKKQKIDNIAVISDETDVKDGYKTNTSYPLTLIPGSCVPEEQCPEPPLENCGGDNEVCESDNDCNAGFSCNYEGDCVRKDEMWCKNSGVNAQKGKNSPDNAGSEILINTTEKDLVLGQFDLSVNSCSAERNFSFDAVTLSIVSNSTGFNLSNIRLIYDVNGNGKFDKDENIIAEGMIQNTIYIKFLIDLQKYIFSGSTKHHFIFVADVDYTLNVSGSSESFSTEISSKDAISVSDSGDATVQMDKISFPSFLVEPEGDYFIFTKQKEDVEVPQADAFSEEMPILPLRAKAIAGENAIKSIRVRTVRGYAEFGEGIASIILYEDTDNDGAGDIELSRIKPDSGDKVVEFDNLKDILTFNEGEEKFLIISAVFNLKSEEKAKIQIGTTDVSLTRILQIKSLPIESKEFFYECKNDEDCSVSGVYKKEDGCGCLVVSGSNNDNLILLIISLLLLTVVQTRFNLKNKE